MDELWTPYVRPQENGNRADVRWVAMTDARGAGLKVMGMPALNFSLHRFTTHDIETARHATDLVPRADLTLHLDHRQHGLGSNACGPQPLPDACLRPEPFRFGLSFAPCMRA